MRKTVLLVAVIALLVGLSCAAMATTPLPYSTMSNGSSLGIDRTLVDSTNGIWKWDFSLTNCTDSSVIHFFNVGFNMDVLSDSLDSYIVPGSLTASNGATGEIGAERITWAFDPQGLAHGQSAVFSFKTNLGGIDFATHGVTDNGYSADWVNAPTPAPVPEPGTLAVLATGLTAMAGFMVRKRK